MKLKTAVLLTILGVSAGALIAVGCAQLDKLEPQYAGHPAITTQPTTGPKHKARSSFRPPRKSDRVAERLTFAAKAGRTISCRSCALRQSHRRAPCMRWVRPCLQLTRLSEEKDMRARADAYADALTQFATGAQGVAGAVSQLNPQAGAAVAEAGKVAGAVAGAIKTP